MWVRTVDSKSTAKAGSTRVDLAMSLSLETREFFLTFLTPIAAKVNELIDRCLLFFTHRAYYLLFMRVEQKPTDRRNSFSYQDLRYLSVILGANEVDAVQVQKYPIIYIQNTYLYHIHPSRRAPLFSVGIWRPSLLLVLP